MPEPTDFELFEAVRGGKPGAFERVYDRYHARLRMVAWRISHRADWLDDLLAEAWCRAYDQRLEFDPGRPFLLWMTGILQNVYREHCRESRRDGSGGVPERAFDRPEPLTPEDLVHDAEILFGLNECVERLPAADARLVRRRFFDGAPLRVIAQEFMIPEATLREVRFPAILRELKRCLERKGIRFSQVFPAQGLGKMQ